MESATLLWGEIKEKYGKPGLGQAFIEFKAAMNTSIPPNQDPAPALDKIMMHFTRLTDYDLHVPSSIQSMILLAKACHHARFHGQFLLLFFLNGLLITYLQLHFIRYHTSKTFQNTIFILGDYRLC